MYTLEEIKSFADPNTGAISKEVGEGIMTTFNSDLTSTLARAAKRFYADICVEVAIRNYKVRGITTRQTVEIVVIKFLYDKMNQRTRSDLLKLPILPSTKDSIKSWIFSDYIRPKRSELEYVWDISTPN